MLFSNCSIGEEERMKENKLYEIESLKKVSPEIVREM